MAALVVKTNVKFHLLPTYMYLTNKTIQWENCKGGFNFIHLEGNELWSENVKWNTSLLKQPW